MHQLQLCNCYHQKSISTIKHRTCHATNNCFYICSSQVNNTCSACLLHQRHKHLPLYLCLACQHQLSLRPFHAKHCLYQNFMFTMHVLDTFPSTLQSLYYALRISPSLIRYENLSSALIAQKKKIPLPNQIDLPRWRLGLLQTGCS